MSAAVIARRVATEPQSAPQREAAVSLEQSFAEILGAARRGADMLREANTALDATARQALNPHTLVLRFVEAGVFGRPDTELPRPEANALSHAPEARRMAPETLAAPGGTAQQAQAPTRLEATTAQPHTPIVARAAQPSKVRSPDRTAPSIGFPASPTQRPEVNQAAARPVSKTQRALPNAGRFGAVLVALHAVEAELCVYARTGRMAPAERDRLRQAMSAVLREYGASDATIVLDEMGAQHG